ncbi:MAG: TIGR03936 family radical SAM-associated protein [Christensenellaceae bacterium]|jgi:radical SAM-linked protein
MAGRVNVKYSRTGVAKYLSHLDMQRLVSRAIRRTGADVQYSSGFNPHIVLSFASPLSVGYATEGDYFECVLLSGSAAEFEKKLNAVLPAGVKVKKVFYAAEKQKKLMAMNYSAIYEILFRFENDGDCAKIKKVALEFFQAQVFLAKDRKGREVDIRPLVLEMEWQQGKLACELKNASDGALNPAVLAEALLKQAEIAADYDIIRVECCYCDNGRSRPFGELGTPAPYQGADID